MGAVGRTNFVTRLGRGPRFTVRLPPPRSPSSPSLHNIPVACGGGGVQVQGSIWELRSHEFCYSICELQAARVSVLVWRFDLGTAGRTTFVIRFGS